MTAPEAALMEGIKVYPVDSLGRLAAHLRDYHPIEPYQISLDLETDAPVYAADFCDIKGQEHVKRLKLHTTRQFLGQARKGERATLCAPCAYEELFGWGRFHLNSG